MQKKSNKNLFKTAISIALCTVLVMCTAVLAEEHKPDSNSGSWDSIPNRIDISFDQQPEKWAIEGVDGLRANGLLGESMLKDYNKPLTRFEFAELVVSTYHKAAKIPYDGSKYISSSFTDINNSHVNEAFSLGIVKGVGNNRFEPYSNIERQAVCVMLVRLLKKIKPDISTGDGKDVKFADEAKIEPWAKPDVAFCYKNGIMTGVAEKTIDPLGNVTREQIYTLLYRFCVKYGIIEKAVTDPDYYMLNGFKVPRKTTLYVSSGMEVGLYITLGGKFNKADTEQQLADMREILISGGISAEIVDKVLNGMKDCYKEGLGAEAKTTESGFTISLKSDRYSFGVSISK